MVVTTWASVALKLDLLNKSYGEIDDGDYDFHSVFELTYDAGTVLWRGKQTRSSNLGGAWG